VTDEIGSFQIERVTHVRVDGAWIEVVVGSVEPCEISWRIPSADPEARQKEDGLAFHALDTSLTARMKVTTYVPLRSISGYRTRSDAEPPPPR